MLIKCVYFEPDATASCLFAKYLPQSVFFGLLWTVLGSNHIGPHHFVVLMLNDVAVPDV